MTRVTEIDVSFSADHEVPTMNAGRPLLTWGQHPEHGNGWTLWYLEDPSSETSGVDAYFIPGDLTDVDVVVRAARAYIDNNDHPRASD